MSAAPPFAIPVFDGLRLEFGQPQTAVAIVFAVLVAAIVGVFVLVALQTRRDVPLESVQRIGYRLRRRWLAFLLALLVIVVGGSLFFLPYAGGSRPDLVVEVSGGQFYWSMTPAEVPVGAKVRFDVTSADVNHGFGIYDPGGKMLGSVQAMPGFHNKLDLTFERPGEYLVSCLEYCGVGHQAMARRFKVVER